MSVLEVFTIKIDADASDLVKGADKAEKTTQQLTSKIKEAEKSSKGLGLSFKNMITSAAGAFGAILSVGAFTVGIKSSAAYAEEVSNLSDALGMAVSDTDAWNNAVVNSGGNINSFGASAKNLNAGLAEFSSKGSSRLEPFFASLGISMLDAAGNARKVSDVLPDLAESFSKLSTSEAVGLGQKLGLDQATILLLSKGKIAVDDAIKRQKELGVVTKKDADIAKDFNNQLADLKASFRSVFVSVSSSVLPAFTKILGLFEKLVLFFKSNSKFIEGALIAIGSAVLVFLVPPLIKAAAAALVLQAPFIATIAIVGALAAVFAILYEDIMAFLSGQSSFIGDLLNRFPILGKVFKAVADAFKAAWNLISGAIKSDIQKIINFFGFIQKAFSKIKGLFSGSDTEIAQTLKITRDSVDAANASPFSSSSTQSIINSSRALSRNTSINVGDVNIETRATDAQGISLSIRDGLEDQIRSANILLDDGVAA